MDNLARLAAALHHVTGIDAKNFALSKGLWEERSFLAVGRTLSHSFTNRTAARSSPSTTAT